MGLTSLKAILMSLYKSQYEYKRVSQHVNRDWKSLDRVLKDSKIVLVNLEIILSRLDVFTGILKKNLESFFEIHQPHLILLKYSYSDTFKIHANYISPWPWAVVNEEIICQTRCSYRRKFGDRRYILASLLEGPICFHFHFLEYYCSTHFVSSHMSVQYKKVLSPFWRCKYRLIVLS